MRATDETLAFPLPGNPEHPGAWLFRQRSWLPVPLALGLLTATHASSHDPVMREAGLALAACGELLRVWAVRHIGVISRTRSNRTGPLITSGPYAWIRNPLYLGNWFLWSGVAVFSAVTWMLPIVWMTFAFIYTNISAWEQGLLLQRQPAYATYLRRTPAWISVRRTVVSGAPTAVFEWRDVFFCERGSLAALVLMIALLTWRQW
jgi:protein-S-isoprenylcysteine O-methyltransferase Ste14